MSDNHCYDRFLHINKLPNIWCPGCGNGIVLQALLRAIDNSGYDPNKVVVVSGIGCSSRAVGYLKLNTVHTLHGRAIAFATGIKLAAPELKVIVLTGDGDCVSIGCNHLIHAARRNIDISVLVFNNSNYGMTGGQYSPTTADEAISKTSVYGNIDRQLDVCELAKSAGASYVARATTYHIELLSRYISNAMEHKGFSIVDAMCDCPSLYGRINGLGNGAYMIKRWKDICCIYDPRHHTYGEPPEGKLFIGEFVKKHNVAEYCCKYALLREKAKEVNWDEPLL